MDVYQRDEILEDHKIWLETNGEKGKRANFWKATLDYVKLSKTDLRKANFQGASLIQTDFREAKLQGANLIAADLTGANLTRAYLRKAELNSARLIAANFAGADLREANLMHAELVKTNFEHANLTGCSIYGTSVWNLKLNDKTMQSNLIITPSDEPAITVDNLEVAQFIYLLLKNEKVRQIIDTITSKVVLILGRFTEERKAVLDAIREEIRRRNLTPILFDFDKPASKDVTGTVETLARMARFIIADLTDASSIPHELATIVPFLRTTPVVPIRLEGAGGYTMFDDLEAAYKWVLPKYEYKDGPSLIKALPKKVIGPAEKHVKKLRGK